MAANKKNARNTEKKSLPLGPMIISFLVGAFIMFLLHLNNNVTPDTNSDNQGDNKHVAKSKTIEPTFDFYTLLPEMETVVDTPKPPKKAIVTSPSEKVAKQTRVETKKDSVSYLLQVGSFKNSKDADGFKARLAFLGIESKVQSVTIDNKDTWHRVQVGPIQGRAQADTLQNQLKQNNIDSLLMRAKHS